jgi:hypothetical protein
MILNEFYGITGGGRTMSYTKHTPGPWTAEKCGATCSLVEILAGSPLAPTRQVVGWAQGMAVAGHAGENAWANARLMAAAPDLFAACEEARLALLSDDAGVKMAAITTLEEVIREAKGGA